MAGSLKRLRPHRDWRRCEHVRRRCRLYGANGRFLGLIAQGQPDRAPGRIIPICSPRMDYEYVIIVQDISGRS